LQQVSKSPAQGVDPQTEARHSFTPSSSLFDTALDGRILLQPRTERYSAHAFASAAEDSLLSQRYEMRLHIHVPTCTSGISFPIPLLLIFTQGGFPSIPLPSSLLSSLALICPGSDAWLSYPWKTALLSLLCAILQLGDRQNSMVVFYHYFF